MKRSPLRKKSNLRRQSKEPISRLQRKLWTLCKEIIRKKYGNVCYTCGQSGLSGSNWHTGHMWAKASLGAYMKYDLRVLRPQCYRCNIHGGGMGADFYAKMVREIGQERMAELEKGRQVIVNAYDHYLKMVGEYEIILKDLSTSTT